jgi:hypothetical protein
MRKVDLSAADVSYKKLKKKQKDAARKAIRKIRHLAGMPLTASLDDLVERLGQIDRVAFRGREEAGVDFGGR